MSDKSIYHLVYDLIQSEQEKLRTSSDNDFSEILLQLKKNSGCNFNDTEDWVNWFVEGNGSKSTEVESIKTVWKIHKIEKVSLKKIRDKN